MSAYIVGKPHIDALVQLGLSGPTGREVNPGNAWHRLSWYVGTYPDWERHELTSDDVDHVGRMLWQTNWRSVAYRYNDDPELPGPCDFTPEQVFGYTFPMMTAPRLTAVQGLKAISGYEYQACELPTWHGHSAQEFCEALRHGLISCLPGYNEADTWEVMGR